MIGKQEAKELTIEKWSYFRDNPQTQYIDQLPEPILVKNRGFKAECALCELFNRYDANTDLSTCLGCPLLSGHRQIGCGLGSLFFHWGYAKTDEQRSEYAGEIVRVVEAWDTGEEPMKG